jgi:hypothetical protein
MKRIRFNINEEDRGSDHAIDDSKKAKHSLVPKLVVGPFQYQFLGITQQTLANGSQLLFNR